MLLVIFTYLQVPRAQTIFVAQAGRKFRLFSLTMQRYEKFKALPNYFSKKARKKARRLKRLTKHRDTVTV